MLTSLKANTYFFSLKHLLFFINFLLYEAEIPTLRPQNTGLAIKKDLFPYFSSPIRS